MDDTNPSAADPLGLIADEFVEAFRQGQSPSVEEFARRYPAHADEIREILPALVLMEKAKAPDPDSAEGTRSAATPPLRQLGEYQILREIGRGGMGVVYEAQQLSLGRHVAIKVLPSHALLDPRQLGRFRREARSAARLHHTNIVPVFGVGEQDGLHYYVMQFIPGLGLDVVLDELRRLRQPHEKPAPTPRRTPGRPTNGSPDVATAGVARGLLTGAFAANGGCQPPVTAIEPGVDTPRSPDMSATIHLPGQSEGSALSESGRQYWRSVARVGLQVADALAYAAGQGVQHRDIKPSNLLLDDTGNVWVTDFGLAKAASDGDDLTQTGDIVGTLRYMAPERFSGQGDLRSDVYSLGLTLYELLALRPAFDRVDRNQLVKQVMHDEPVRLRKLNPRVPRDLETVVLKAIARDPARRYQTAGALADDLQRFLDGRPITARPVGRPERAVKWVKRNPVVAGMAVAVVLALAVGTTVSYLKYREAEAALARESERVKERDYQLGISNFLLAVAAYDNRDVKLAAERLDKVPQEQRGWEWAYLQRQTRGGLFTLHGHTHFVSSVSFSPDGARIVTGSHDRTAKVWDARTGQETLTLKGHTNIITSVSFSPDGTRIVTGSGDGTARIWDARTGMPLLDLKGHTSHVTSVAFSSDGSRIVTGSWDGTARIWDARTGTSLFDLKGHTSQVAGVSFSPDGTRVVTGSGDTTARVWDASTGTPLLELKGHTHGVTSVGLSPDGARIVTGSNEKTAKVWDACTGAPLLDLKGHTSYVTSVSFSPDGGRIVSGSWDGTARIWEARTGAPLLDLKGHTDWVESVSFSPDGERLVTGGRDTTARVWDARTGTPVIELKGHTGPVTSVSFSRDPGAPGRIATGSGDGTAKVWDVHTGTLLLDLKGHTHGVTSVAFSPDGARLLTGSEDRTAKVWETRTGTPLLELKGHTDGVRSVAFSPDGARIVTGGGQTAKVWDARTGAPLLDLEGHTNGVTSVSFSPDGARLVTGSEDQTAKVWDACTGTPVLDLKGHTSHVTSVSFSPDGGRIVSGSGDGTARIWDARTGRPLLDFKGHTFAVWSVGFSPDGARLVTGSSDKTAKVWDARTGTPLLDLKGITDRVMCVGFSPDGKRIVTSSRDRTATVWDTRIGQEREGNQPLDAEELEYRLFHTLPNARNYSEDYAAARKANDRFAACFYLDRLLSLPTQRTTERFQERNAFQADPLVIARTGFHHPALAKTPYDRGMVSLLAIQGDCLARRLVAQELLREGKPGPAIPLLFWCLASRPAASPPVEELLLAQAYYDLKQPAEAKRFYRAATDWLDQPQNPRDCFGGAFALSDDPRRNPFDWEAWHECDVFRAVMDAKAK